MDGWGGGEVYAAEPVRQVLGAVRVAERRCEDAGVGGDGDGDAGGG